MASNYASHCRLQPVIFQMAPHVRTSEDNALKCLLFFIFIYLFSFAPCLIVFKVITFYFISIVVVYFCVIFLVSPDIIIGEGNGNPLQDSCLENHTDRGSWLQSTGHKESDMTEWRTLSVQMPYFHIFIIMSLTHAHLFFSEVACIR